MESDVLACVAIDYVVNQVVAVAVIVNCCCDDVVVVAFVKQMENYYYYFPGYLDLVSILMKHQCCDDHLMIVAVAVDADVAAAAGT